MWAELILSYYRSKKSWRVSKLDFMSQLGMNHGINRKLKQEAVDLIFESLVKNKKAIYTSTTKEEIFLLWRSIQGWQEYLYDSAYKHQKIDSIETIDYIVGDDDNISEEYYGMDQDLLLLILKNLEKENKCIV